MTHLRCRVCETEYPAGRERDLRALLRAARAGLRLGRGRAGRLARAIEAGPRSLWRYAALLPAAAAAGRRRRPGLDAARPGAAPCRARSASARCCLKLDHANPTHSFKDRVVAVAAAKARRVRARDARVRVDRQPRRTPSPRARPRRACARSIFCPARARAGEAARDGGLRRRRSTRVRGSYDDCSRLVVELAGEVDWGFVNVNLRAYYAEGSKTLAFEIAEQLGWETPDAVVMPDRLRLDVHEDLAGLRAVRAARARRRDAARASSAARPQGCSPVAARVRGRPAACRRCGPNTVAHSLAIGNPADGDLAVATARASGGAHLRGPGGGGRRRTCRCSPGRQASSARRPRA